MSDAEGARDWLAARGVTQRADGTWTGRSPSGGELHTANEVTHAGTEEALTAPGLDEVGRLRRALGLLDALLLLDRLDLPADTPHLARLRKLFAAGHVNHYRSPDAWEAAGPQALPKSTSFAVAVPAVRPGARWLLQ